MAASIQKFVIILTWKLQNVCKVLSLSRWECGKPRGKCGIQPEKQAWTLEFWTLSTGFSTCGKNRADIRWVKRFGCGKLLPPAKRRMLGVQRDNTYPMRCCPDRSTEISREKNHNSMANTGFLCYTSRWVIIACCTAAWKDLLNETQRRRAGRATASCDRNGRSTVSYTHLTLPTT